jgi:pimeloyl-ACP methyl ester carboxylesterase
MMGARENASPTGAESTEKVEPKAEPSASGEAVVRVRDLTARGVRVRFSERGDGPALFLLHDFMQTRATFDAVSGELARRYRVITPDFPGFGESEKPDPTRYAYGYLEFASVVADLVSATCVGRASVCGVGLGASVALSVAGEHKDHVDKLVLVSPIVYEHDPSAFERVLTMPLIGGLVFKQIVGRKLFTRHFQRSVYKDDADGRDDALARYYDAFNSPAARQAAHATLTATRDTRPLVAIVPRISSPTLVVWGRHDRRVPVEHGRRLTREIAGARLEVLECGHAAPEEVPEAFARVLGTFLGSFLGKKK